MRASLSLLLGAVLLPAAAASAACSFTTVATTMLLDGDCTTNSTISIPDGWTLDGRGYTITAMETAPGTWVGAVVKTAGAKAHVRNLNVTASGLTCACKGGDDRLRGILFEGAGGSIRDSSAIGINKGGGACGCQEGNGIELRNPPYDGTGSNPPEVEVRDNVVHDYLKGGIVVLGNVDANIKDNDIEGLDMTPSIASNGIQVSYGASGKVEKNRVDGNWFTGASWTASGILVFETNSVQVRKNVVENNQSGLIVESWCFFAPSADGNELKQNQVFNSQWGISVTSYAWGFSSCDPTADGNNVEKNDISTPAGDIGIYVGGVDLAPPYTASADSNRLKKNDISGFVDAIIDDGTNTRISFTEEPTESLSTNARARGVRGEGASWATPGPVADKVAADKAAGAKRATRGNPAPVEP